MALSHWQLCPGGVWPSLALWVIITGVCVEGPQGQSGGRDATEPWPVSKIAPQTETDLSLKCQQSCWKKEGASGRACGGVSSTLPSAIGQEKLAGWGVCAHVCVCVRAEGEGGIGRASHAEREQVTKLGDGTDSLCEGK